MKKGQKLVLQKLTEEQSNKKYTFAEISPTYNGTFTMSLKGIYYPYNHEIRDSGWGCAWRAVQTLLSTQDIFLSFEELYDRFCEKEDLMKILEKSGKYNSEIFDELRETDWAPVDISSHWAQPFIASLACHFYNLPHRLLFLNGPAPGNAPPSVFDATLTFRQFYQLLKRSITLGSVMIDDGYFALSIIGIRQVSEDVTEMLFADPHIRSNKLHKEVGLYCRTFDRNGKAIKDKQTECQKSESLYEVYQKLEFESKYWRICLLDK